MAKSDRFRFIRPLANGQAFPSGIYDDVTGKTARTILEFMEMLKGMADEDAPVDSPCEREKEECPNCGSIDRRDFISATLCTKCNGVWP